jgi:hypothetical protein
MTSSSLRQKIADWARAMLRTYETEVSKERFYFCEMKEAPREQQRLLVHTPKYSRSTRRRADAVSE